MDATIRGAISGANPSGENLRYELIYGEIRAGIRRARGEVLPDPDGEDFRAKSVMWRFVIGTCRDLLRWRSKDLMLAAWLTEAQLAVDGLTGLRDGLDVLCALVETFWETLYPEMEEGDAEARLRIFEWLDTRLAQVITVKESPDFFTTEASYRRRLPELIDCRDSLSALDRACWEKAGTQRTFHNLQTVILGTTRETLRRLVSVVEERSPSAASVLRGGYRDWITRSRLEELLRDESLHRAPLAGQDDERLHANDPEPSATPAMSVPPPAPSMAPPSPAQIHSGLKWTVKGKGILPAEQRVVFTLTAPEKVTAKVAFELFIWAHDPRDRAKILARAREELGGDVLERAKGPVRIAAGTVLNVRLTIPGAEIAEPEDMMVWDGESTCVSFVITLPALGEGGKAPGVAHIYASGVQVAKISFVLSAVGVAEVSGMRFRKAFASYASADRDAVLGRIQGIHKILPELDVFLDVVSLRSGQDWEQELWRVIPASDIFYLFWSSHARQSEWVEKEWRCALRERGLEFIDPVPLEPPQVSPPPPELSSLHFNDWELAFMRGRVSN